MNPDVSDAFEALLQELQRCHEEMAREATSATQARRYDVARGAIARAETVSELIGA